MLKAWQRGRTGYPLVDAGMRQLWLTGWMQQSIRMVCAAFLTEYLNIHWIHGERCNHPCTSCPRSVCFVVAIPGQQKDCCMLSRLAAQCLCGHAEVLEAMLKSVPKAWAPFAIFPFLSAIGCAPAGGSMTRWWMVTWRLTP